MKQFSFLQVINGKGMFLTLLAKSCIGWWILGQWYACELGHPTIFQEEQWPAKKQISIMLILGLEETD